MYSTVSARIGISWCAQYCVNKDRSLSVYSAVPIRIWISWSLQYCVSMDRDILVCTVMC